MGTFSTSMAKAWAASKAVFGDTITIGGQDYDCVIHGFAQSDGVQSGRPGRVQSVVSTVVMALTDWTAATGRKGIQVTIGGTTYRVSNDPDVGFTSDTVELTLAPLT